MIPYFSNIANLHNPWSHSPLSGAPECAWKILPPVLSSAAMAEASTIVQPASAPSASSKDAGHILNCNIVSFRLTQPTIGESALTDQGVAYPGECWCETT